MTSPGAPAGASAAAALPAEVFDIFAAQLAAAPALGQRVHFEGEVTDVRSREVLVAAADWSFAIRVVPHTPLDVRFGDWVRVAGELQLRTVTREATHQLQVARATVTRVGRSRRAAALDMAMSAHRRPRGPEARRLTSIHHVAIVSTQGHGLRDVLATLERADLTHTLYEADFSSSSSIANAIHQASADGRIATLVTRGGGSRMELEPVNSLEVAAAARASSAFTVLAVGHESDVFDVACAFDRTCGTPSKGAALFVAIARAGSADAAWEMSATDTQSRSAPPRSPSHRQPPSLPLTRRGRSGVAVAVGLLLACLVLFFVFGNGHDRGYQAGLRACPVSSASASPQSSSDRSPLSPPPSTVNP